MTRAETVAAMRRVYRGKLRRGTGKASGGWLVWESLHTVQSLRALFSAAEESGCVGMFARRESTGKNVVGCRDPGPN